jgi:hypothetical protein
LYRRVVWQKFTDVSEVVYPSIIRPMSKMLNAESTSETSVNVYQTTRRHNPEDSYLHKLRRLWKQVALVYLLHWQSVYLDLMISGVKQHFFNCVDCVASVGRMICEWRRQILGQDPNPELPKYEEVLITQQRYSVISETYNTNHKLHTHNTPNGTINTNTLTNFGLY